MGGRRTDRHGSSSFSNLPSDGIGTTSASGGSTSGRLIAFISLGTLCSLIAVGVGLFGLLNLASDFSASVQSSAQARKTSTALSNINATATHAQQATGTALAYVDATATHAQQATGTALAYVDATATQAQLATSIAPARQDLLQETSQWPTILFEPFDTNVNGWPVWDESRGGLTKNWLQGRENWSGTRLLANGKYRWQAKAHKEVAPRVLPEAFMRNVEDFYLAVEGQRVKGPVVAAYGVEFRVLDGNSYAFKIIDDGRFSFSFFHDEKWTSIIDWTETSVIRLGEANRLTVVAEGSHFVFYINDEYVGEADDSRLTTGKIGLAISLYNIGDDAIYEFDNFELRVP